ncbi:GDP-mannose 4,6-dehydratase [Candidatus Pelagibacter sp.]|nr:GDP-mannose 4,6-dehydratase [Candidatus Pelagibacter sp.]
MYSLILGGLGFIGLNYILQNVNKKIICVDNQSYAANSDYLKILKKNKNFTFIKGNISNKKILVNIFNKYRINHIINFAAETHVDNSILNPKIFVKRNVYDFVEFLINLSNIIKQKKIKIKYLHISTDEVYGSLKKKQNKFTENDKFFSNSPYSASKASAENFLRSWGETFGFKYIIVNPSNNFGPYQNREKFIPTIINSLIQKKKIPVYGNGSNIRDWLFVNDHCKILNKILEKGINGESYNVGGNNELSNLNLVKKICLIFNKIDPDYNHFKLIDFVKDRSGHDFRYGINNAKIKKLIGQKFFQMNFDKNLKYTINWYLKNKSKRSRKKIKI